MNKTHETPHQALLDYLQRIPFYRYDDDIDPDFVNEIVDDFGNVLDVLDEAKAFRWYHADRATSHLRSPRLSLRRWFNNAKTPRRRQSS